MSEPETVVDKRARENPRDVLNLAVEHGKRADELEEERDQLAARVAELEAALLATKRITNQFGGPCWCDTVARLYCCAQPQCARATELLKEKR